MTDQQQELSYAHGTSEVPLLGDTVGGNLSAPSPPGRDREALVDVPSGRRWTYAEFGADVDRLARGLLARGVAKGDRVGIWAVNCPEWVLVQYATARIGAVMVNINPAYRAHELAYVLKQSGVSVLVSSPGHKGTDYHALVRQVAPDCPELRDRVFIGEHSWGRPLPRRLLGTGRATGRP
ncbi:AMP-binding protein [Streptomyces sp. KL116D]|uniref:AMP-binding protein n=1 Tax=Streptomyces sp. KL116D TaxID=3045152 RepID=UPI003555D9C9